MSILIDNCTIVPMDGGEKYFRGAVGITGDSITMVSPQSDGDDHLRRKELFVRESGPGLRVIDGSGKAVMPGLINTHGHAAMTLMRGFADDIPLFRWLNDYVWPFEQGLTPEAVELGTRLAIAEMLLGGTTTYADMYWMQASAARAVEESGVRAMLCPTFIDANFATFEADLEKVAAMRRPGGLIGVMIAPHAPYTCSEEYLRRAIELSRRYDAGLTIHVSETRDEVAAIRERYGKTSVEMLRDAGLFSRPVLAVHTVHVTDGDIDIMKQYGVSASHNPQSNMKIASGTAPVVRMLEKGLNVAIGTDGACSNNDLDMWDEMRSASFLQKLAASDPTVLPAYKILEMATVNGAKALGLENVTGTVTEGKKADVILIDLTKPHMVPLWDLIGNLVYCAKSSDVETVIVNGRITVEDKECKTLDVNAIRTQAQQYIDSRRK